MYDPRTNKLKFLSIIFNCRNLLLKFKRIRIRHIYRKINVWRMFWSGLTLPYKTILLFITLLLDRHIWVYPMLWVYVQSISPIKLSRTQASISFLKGEVLMRAIWFRSKPFFFYFSLLSSTHLSYTNLTCLVLIN